MIRFESGGSDGKTDEGGIQPSGKEAHQGGTRQGENLRQRDSAMRQGL
jgi:hypothetical protein